MTGLVAGDLVKVAEAEHAGRWGRVVAVIDYRDTPNAEPPAPEGVDLVVWVDLKTARRRTLVSVTTDPVPFEPYELAPLFDDMTDCTGTWVRAGRVVSRAHWPRTRPEAYA